MEIYTSLEARIKRASKPRITFEVTQEQYNLLKQHIPYGLQRLIFSSLVDDLVPLLKEYGGSCILAILDGQVSFRSAVSEYHKRNIHTSSITLGTERSSSINHGDT
jgi:hypothetical protein